MDGAQLQASQRFGATRVLSPLVEWQWSDCGGWVEVGPRL
jgi:hypothetical protein